MKILNCPAKMFLVFRVALRCETSFSRLSLAIGGTVCGAEREGERDCLRAAEGCAATLESEYAGALGFLEACKKLGAPRYVVKTELDPENALPHVLAVVERVLAASSLRFLLAEDALERADANPL